ncbi:PREDICTED: protein transport protein Sec16A [Chrysochloris asiatica]|uniref:Protein transport protein sec16 n=1 Tax=Chrysochloris asiatica TaxID=185453 RepID=A0A9B0TG79_CHRAS|nr:PREDICTED: protein transport protein Sec16A [Chrysochloris asiatica]
MQPPPQAAPSGLVGPPPVGNPRTVFWPNSPYRKRTPTSTPVPPVTCPLQPVTDPFAFSRQVTQDTSLDTVPRSSLPFVPGCSPPPGLPPHASLATPHTSAGGPQGPCQPVPGPFLQPGVDGSHFARVVTPPGPPGTEMSRSAEMGSSSTSNGAAPPNPQYIPGVGSEGPRGAAPGPARPLGRQNPQDGAGPPALASFFPQPPLPAPDSWVPVQGSPRPVGPQFLSCPEGPGHSAVPRAPGLSHFLPQPSGHQGPSQEQQCHPLALVPGPLAGDERDETTSLHSGGHLASHFDPENTFRQSPRVGPAWANQSFRQTPEEQHMQCPPGTGGTRARCPPGGEMENEEDLSVKKASSGASSASEGPRPGPPPAHLGPHGDTTQTLENLQPYFPQCDQPSTGQAAVEVWGGVAGPQCENVENLEFIQNQEVLPSETLNDPFRYGALPGVGAPNWETPEAALQPARPDSGSSSGKGHWGLLNAARPQELAGTFIQQEVGKPEEEASGNFFKQIDSSPVGGETEETLRSQNRGHSQGLSQPLTPSPPKPTGIFQTSANSSFEPVKSHLIVVKPVESDRANVVGEVRGSHGCQKKRRPTAVPPDASPGNLEQPPDNMETLFTPLSTAAEAGGLPANTVLTTPEKRSSARTQGPMKCESPATTLWAQSELPDLGGSVLLAPAAPALCVPVRAQASEVIQPPDEGGCGPLSQMPGCGSPIRSGDGIGASENLENPPKMGEEEAFQSQASSGYASLLPSPPTGPLHCQLALAAQPIHFPSSNAHEKTVPQREPLVGDRLALSSEALGSESGEGAPVLAIPSHGLVNPPLSSSLPQSVCLQAASPETLANQPANLLVQPPALPVNQGNRATETLPPTGASGVVLVLPAPNPSSSLDETSGALDFTIPRTLGPPDSSAAAQQTLTGHPRPPGPGAPNPDHFYQQVTKAPQGQKGPERVQPESGSLQQSPPAPQVPRTALPESSGSGSPLAPGQTHDATTQPPASPAPADTGQQPWPPQSSGTSVTSASSNQAAGPSDLQWPRPLPPDLSSYYYYRSLYDTYPAQYPSAYPLEPGAAPRYYQDAYSLYRPYDNAAAPAYPDSYRCPEPERPSSRASHCSDRPAPRQGYQDGGYHPKGGWSSQSDYYANYYSGQYDYGGHWDRYHYGSGTSRFRDAGPYDRNYWYDAEYTPYRKEPYAYGDRLERDGEPWRYDPRFMSSFEEGPELHRDPCGDEGDRRSVHSELSAQSLHSRRSSSFSSHSQQSQIYRNHNMPISSYDAPAPPGDDGYDTYGDNFNGGQGFPEYGYPAGTSWPIVDPALSRPSSPEKFSVPHVCARFGPGGQLIEVIPNLPSEGQPALVEVHSMETLLQHSPEQEEMRAFPGPLGKDDTHKVDVINFAQNKATKCFQNESIIDKGSASLLWNLIILLCRQNGTVVGTDIAELLMHDHKTSWLPGKSPNEANLIDFTSEAVEQQEEEAGEAQLAFLTDSQGAGTSSLDKETERFRELLLYGRKKDALESAMKNGLWGHALLLASKMDNRTHARVMTRFANSLPINDPLQTVYQLLSGRMPAASMCCGDEKWGDWRPHLAMVLSNLSNNLEVEARTMTTMGDTLASKGLLEAAHFCYLMAQAGFGVYTKKTAKLVLIGSNHSWPFLKFATNEAIQRTEAYEYAQSLGAHTCSLPHFQVFKFIYACRLADMGLTTQAFHYCEVIAKSILARPHAHSTVLIGQLIQVASQLRLFDPQLKEKPEEESFVEPSWLVQLQQVKKQIEEGGGAWQQDGAIPTQCPGSPSSEMEQYEGPGPRQPAALDLGNPLLTLPSTELSGPSELLPSAPQIPPSRVPMFPVPPPGPVEPGPVCVPPDSTLGFPEPVWSDPTAPYPGQQDESGRQDPGTSSRESPMRNSHVEWGEEGCGGDVVDVVPSSHSLLPGSPEGCPHSSGVSCLLRQRFALFNGPRQWSPVFLKGGAGHEAPEARPLLGGGGLLCWADLEIDPDPMQVMLVVRENVVLEAGVSMQTAAACPAAVIHSESVESWFSRWLPGKKRTEAYLPDDKNKSIVWDEKKNQWVNLNEPEEEKKPPPPPPMALAPQAAPPAPGGPPRATVNVFSRKAAGSRARYVDVLNPSGTTRGEPALAPTEIFAPLAPLPVPAKLFVPGADTNEPQPVGVGDPGGQMPAGGQARLEPTSETKTVNSAAQPLHGSELSSCDTDMSQGGQLSRCSSVSSLSQEVSRHFDQVPAGGPPGGAVTFYNPAQFAQAQQCHSPLPAASLLRDTTLVDIGGPVRPCQSAFQLLGLVVFFSPQILAAQPLRVSVGVDSEPVTFAEPEAPRECRGGELLQVEVPSVARLPSKAARSPALASPTSSQTNECLAGTGGNGPGTWSATRGLPVLLGIQQNHDPSDFTPSRGLPPSKAPQQNLLQSDWQAGWRGGVQGSSGRSSDLQLPHRGPTLQRSRGGFLHSSHGPPTARGRCGGNGTPGPLASVGYQGARRPGLRAVPEVVGDRELWRGAGLGPGRGVVVRCAEVTGGRGRTRDRVLDQKGVLGHGGERGAAVGGWGHGEAGGGSGDVVVTRAEGFEALWLWSTTSGVILRSGLHRGSRFRFARPRPKVALLPGRTATSSGAGAQVRDADVQLTRGPWDHSRTERQRLPPVVPAQVFPTVAHLLSPICRSLTPPRVGLAGSPPERLGNPDK